MAIDQKFRKIYNGYRDIVIYKYIVGHTDPNGAKFIMGRAIYETADPIKAVYEAHKEIMAALKRVQRRKSQTPVVGV